MLTDLYVTGFRSLKDFRLSIHPGLNVLIGPNGSGKTNILRFLEFLSHTLTNSLTEAVGLSGGSNAIFDRVTADESGNQYVHVILKGCTEVQSDFVWDNQLDGYHYWYRLELSISFNKKNSRLIYEKQKLQIILSKRKISNETASKRKRFDLEVDFAHGKIEKFFLTERLTKISLVPKIPFKNIISARSEIFSDRQICESFNSFGFPIKSLISDINTGQSYNIIPELARQSEDISREPKISPNGSGLAATINYLSKISDQNALGNEGYFYDENFSEEKLNYFERITRLVRLINDDIISVSSDADFAENRISIHAKLKGEGREIEIPMKFLSDGTVKWLALITAILNTRAIFAIEEPENFLHPKMQYELVELIRNKCSENKNISALLTSHSESLINNLEPHEIILTRYNNGYTEAFRLENADTIREEINRTGFGLGHYYISEILDA